MTEHIRLSVKKGTPRLRRNMLSAALHPDEKWEALLPPRQKPPCQQGYYQNQSKKISQN